MNHLMRGNTSNPSRIGSYMRWVIPLIAVLIGCSHKKEQPSPNVSTDTGTPAQASAPASAPSYQSPAPDQGHSSVSPDAQGALSEAAAALKAKEYERAVQAMVAMQQAKLTEQQAQAARNQMVQLQNDLAAAISRGDAKAKAAADLLRRSASGGQ